MATREQIEHLKAEWKSDPFWDIWNTIGFEDHEEELKKYQAECETIWERVREKDINVVSVRWHDGYLEEFEAQEVRFGSDLLWMRLSNGQNRHIPLRSVRWFGMSRESHTLVREDES